MKSKNLNFSKGFHIFLNNPRSQAATMVLKPGECEGDRTNRHKGSDQWLFVVSGRGSAWVEGRTVLLRPRTLLWIERKDRHEIRNTGNGLLKTLNFYVPPAYTKTGNPLPRGRR